MATSASSSSPAASMVCYNPECKELKPERPRKGWRLRTGELAELCDRCASAFEEGRFCETFHGNASGWRCCESCGKRVHCGCIVSSHLFTLLDPGGIECIACARKNVFLTSNPAWHPSLFFHSPVPERLKDLSVKNWSQLAGSGPVPWRQAPSLFSSSIPSSEMNSRSPYEVDISSALNKLSTTERITVSSTEKKKIEDLSERLQNGCLKLGSREILENGTAGKNCEEQISSCLSMSSSLKEDQSTQQFGLTVPYSSTNDTNEQVGVSGTTLRPSPPSLSKQFIGNLHNGIDSSGDTHIRNARPRADARGKNQLLPRYWPRFTDQELQQISGDSNSVITPLFEKMLSASDAGRIGRLVLPKKCAEAYFPPISQPEGLPLKVQDAKGKGWIFQFRFWPNNNSRMYVLEGVTPCIQSMQLQAGDIVTFSRLEPEGKLVMGFRKASAAPPSDQENETNKNGNGVSARGDAELADPSSWSKVDKSGYIAKEVLGAKALIPRKRKSSTLVSKSKRIRNENEDVMELKLTWEEAQGLLRPPNNHVPSIVVIEGIEFEEYEDAPVLGKPTIFATTNVGGKIQWVQCEDCSKFRKLPADALLPSKWTCSDNSWDPERSVCSAAQELTSEELEDLLPQSVSVAPKKMKAAKQDAEHVEALEGLDTLANLAILGEGDSLPASAQATTKHPRHRSGCSCIVCIQPPSGKGPKHKQTCTCNVCLTVKRRFRTLMLRREKKQSEKEAETTRKKQHQQQLPPQKLQVDTLISSNASDIPKQPKIVCEVLDDEPSKVKTSTSPFKGQIDLNIQPEREEELSPCSDSGDMMKLLQDATERYLRQQKLSSSGGCENPSGNHSRRDGGDAVGGKPNNGINLGSTQHDAADDGCPATLSVKASVSSTAAG
ncbi:B3 domain-containing protein Os07g0563300 isoform X2 [Morus notabilis]|uniref:B3 domain-containing protein Os07g0563300 isoform X2 n=1 Tax=Morus notabilis TaxID=981085 RepID=UPI000CED6888|nr:B3 domain-containing protein Os07g0563300 isoform X2 [Morus notabilis]